MTFRERGSTRLSVVIWLGLLGLVIYVGYKVIPVYMDYERMKDTMFTKASVAQVMKDEDILNDLVSRAKELELPLTAEHFVVKRNEELGTMTIKTAWDVELHFFGDLYVHNIHFAPTVDERFARR
jgi:hypothetical protein